MAQYTWACIWEKYRWIRRPCDKIEYSNYSLPQKICIPKVTETLTSFES